MKIKKDKKGLSMIEVLVAIGFLTIGIFAIAKMFPSGLKVSKSSEVNTLATLLAQEKMENAIITDYDTLGTGTIEAKHKVSLGSFGDIYNFSRETKVSYVDGDLNESVSDTGMKQIEVIIYWTSSSGEEKNISLKRLMSRR